MLRIAAFIVVIGVTLAAWPVWAQFGSYGDSPPRPPADVPNAGFPPQPPPVGYPGQYPSQQQYPPSQPYPPPQQYPAQQQYPAPQQRGPAPSPVARAPSGIQAQPLPPPPGALAAPAAVNRANPAPPAAAGTATAPAPANPPATQQANTPPGVTSPGQEDDTTVIETPTEKIENGRAEFAGLDKITGRTIKFDSAIGETVQFGALQVTARACYTRPPTEPTNTDAFVEVDEVTLQGEIRRIFTGWMFASSPGLNAVEHPIYDVWLTGCEQPLTGPVAESTPMPPPPGTPGPLAEPAPQEPARQGVTPRRPLKPAPPAPEPTPSTDD